MIIDLRALDEASGTVRGTCPVRFTDALDEAVEFDCDVEVRYNHTGGAWYFHVRAAGSCDTSCHRCLDAVSLPLEAEFDVVVRRGMDRAQLRGDVASDDDLVVLGANEHEVSLGPFVHENIVVTVPMLVLCAEDCKGLCERCGANRNRTACQCRPAQDPRWDALRPRSGE